MNKELISRLPRKIDRNVFYRLDEYEVIDEKDIEDTLNKELNEYILREEISYRNSIINKMTQSLKHDFIIDNLKNFFKNSYLIKLKKGMDIDVAVKRSDEEILDIDEKYRTEFTTLNKIIRQITKDRPNDFEDIIKKIQDKIIKKSSIEEVEDKELDEELVDLITEEEKKPDKLTKYINTTYNTLYEECFMSLKQEYKQHYDNYLENQSKAINDKVSKHMTAFKDENVNKFLKEKKSNIVNLFDYLLSNYYTNIQWLDDNKYVIMVNKISKVDKNNYEIVSGSILPTSFIINSKSFKELHSYNSSFTLILEVK